MSKADVRGALAMLLALQLVLQPCADALASGLPPLAVAARSLLGAGQGVYVEAADGTVLLAMAAARPVHPASLSKLPTTLALLRRLGPDYRFETRFGASGPLSAGVLHGDLLVTGSADPYFVDENALLVAATLHAQGLERVAGTLRSSGALLFDWQDTASVARLRAALSGHAPAAAWAEVQRAYPELATPGAQVAPALQFDAGPAADAPIGAVTPLLVHRSQPLVPLLKALNDYSNNIFKPLADAAGGAAQVEAVARAAVAPPLRAEITLGDGAGTDPRNRLSPRAVVALLRALERELALSGHRLVDILPVAGVDAGTLRARLNAPTETGRVLGKTGTFGDYGASALAGAIRTSDRGTVYFAILNHGVPVPVARRRQDALVRVLLASLDTLPWDYQRDERPAVARAQVQVADPPPVH
jgi:D-alanyl-D-alanine carboxypeptidase/D-alanyl-D-alanine-endopeptidase (penicillin-binding protein 4)